MRRTIGTPIHHSALEQGKIYYLKHDSLGEAEVIYQGHRDFYITAGRLTSGPRKQSWGKDQTWTAPEDFSGVHLYEPAA